VLIVHMCNLFFLGLFQFNYLLKYFTDHVSTAPVKLQ
jgi:hypothetical protein